MLHHINRSKRFWCFIDKLSSLRLLKSNSILIVFNIIDNWAMQKALSTDIWFAVQEFKKDASVFYMPPFTLNELEASRVWFPNVTTDRMLELYGKWGGSIRWVLKRGSPKDSIDNANELTQAIDVMRVEMINRASSGGATAEVCFLAGNTYQEQLKRLENIPGTFMTMSFFPLQIISGIIHHVPDPHDLKRYEREFASRYVADELAATAAEPRLLALSKFLSDARPSGWESVQKAYSTIMARQQDRRGPAFQQRLL